MEEGRPSRTAERVAMRRAAHQLLDVPLVFEDPLAFALLDRETEAALRADPASSDTRRAAPYLRAFLAVRSRFAEDRLARAVERGVDQYVVLGAGLDTFAYRNPFGERVRVFEVDHPSTQAWKRARLRESDVTIPPSTRYVPVDLSRESLPAALFAAGLERDHAVFVAWLGVTPYLERDAVLASLRGITSLSSASSEVVFDFAVVPELLSPTQRAVVEVMAARVASVGEPWQSAFDPAELRDTLLELGFREVDLVGPDALNAAYFADRADGLRIGGAAWLIDART